MRLLTLPILLALLVAAGCGGGEEGAASGPSAGDGTTLILATTTSTQDSGLLDVLVPAFEAETGYDVKTVAGGSGEALELGSRGEADVLLVHSPAAEEELMATGKAGERRLVMHNDFVLIGPPDDPASIAESPSAADALTRIEAGQAPFVSRGDDSGTHKLELSLWEAAGIEPAGTWYAESGQGMGATIQIAAETGAYTIADRGTWLAVGGESGLELLHEGDPALLNVYHVIDMTTAAGPRVNAEGGRAFAEWIVSPGAQAMIGEFGVGDYGRPLFVPDAGEAEDELATAA